MAFPTGPFFTSKWQDVRSTTKRHINQPWVFLPRNIGQIDVKVSSAYDLTSKAFSSSQGNVLQKIHSKYTPKQLTWNLKIDHWKRRVLLETTIRFYVEVQGSSMFAGCQNVQKNWIHSGRIVQPHVRLRIKPLTFVSRCSLLVLKSGR